MTSLANKRILILGGTSGFGLAVAQMVLQQQANVYLTGRDPEKLEKVLQTLQQQGYSVKGCVFNAYLDGVAEQCLQSLGPFDHVVSTVGSFMGGGFLDASYDTILKAISEKFNANLAIAKAIASHINTGGSLIFTAGSGGKLYNASGALIGNQNIKAMIQGLAVELAPNIRVNAVSPTWTETPLWSFLDAQQLQELKQTQAKNIPLQRTATIEEVASAYLFLMQNDFITGQNIAVDGGVDLT